MTILAVFALLWGGGLAVEIVVRSARGLGTDNYDFAQFTFGVAAASWALVHLGIF